MTQACTATLAFLVASIVVCRTAAQDIVLRAGEVLRGEVTPASAVLHEVVRDDQRVGLMGVRHPVEVDGDGDFTFEAKSYFFDTLLVLRDGDGHVLAQNDNGGLRTHSRLTYRLAPDRKYAIDVLASDGGNGPYEVSFHPLQERALKDAEAVLRSELEDARAEARARQAALAPEHAACLRSQLDVAECLAALGKYLTDAGRHEEALPMLEEVLATRRQLLPWHHHHLGLGLVALAQCFVSLGRIEDAPPLFLEAVDTVRRLNPSDDPIIATALDSVATSFDTAGRHGDALPLRQQALEMRQRLFTGDHPDVAASLSNVASCLDDLGQVDKALLLYQQSLEMRERLSEGDHQDVATSLNNVAYCLAALGRPDEAIPLHRCALEMRQRLFKGDHPDVATSLSNVASCLDDLGQVDKALLLYQQSLTMRERLFEGDNRDVATSLNNLGSCLQSLGRFGDALPPLSHALDMRQRLFPGDDRRVATSQSNLASCLEDLGRPNEALELHHQSLEMRERLFTEDHDDVARGLNGLAQCLTSFGRLDEALGLLQRSLAMRQRLFSGDHTRVATALNNLAGCLHDVGRSNEALEIASRAFEMRRRLFTGDHPDVATSLNNLGSYRQSLGQLGDALALYRQALEMRQRLFRRDHADVASSLNNLASGLDALGRPDEALPLYQRALEMRQRLFRGDHADVARGLNNVALCLAALGRPDEALPLNRRALAMQQRLFATDHPGVAKYLNNLACRLDDLGDSDEALDLYVQSLEMTLRVMSDRDHPDSATRLANLACCLDSLGRSDEALRWHRLALEMQERLFPGGHPDVASSLSNLGCCYCSLERTDESLELFQRALEMRTMLLTEHHPDVVLSLNNLAGAYADLGRPTEAIALLARSVEVIESARTRAGTLDPGTRESYFGELKRGDPYGLMRALQIAQGDAPGGMRYAERARGRSLLDRLEESRFDPFSETLRRLRERGTLDQEQQVRAVRAQLSETELEIARLEHAVASLAADRTLGAEERHVRQAGLRDEMSLIYRRRRAAVQEERGILADVLPAAEPKDPEQIQALLSAGELMLYFALDDEHSHLFVVPPAPAPIEAIELGLEGIDVDLEVSKLLRILSHGQVVEEDRGPGGLEDDAGARDGSTISLALARALLPGDLWTRIRACTRVWLVPDGSLHRIPFEALVVAMDGDKPVHWLDVGPPIAYAPSGSVLHWVCERARKQQDEQLRFDLVAFGDPAFQLTEPRPVPAQGVLVVAVNERGEGARAGLRPLDVVLSYDGRPLADDAALKAAQRAVQDAIEARQHSGDPVRAAVWRQGEPVDLELELRPGELGIDVGPGAAPVAYEAWQRGSRDVFQRDVQLERFGELKRLPGTRTEVEAAASAFPASRVAAHFDREATEASVFEQAPAAKYLHFATHGLAQQYAGQSFCALALAMPAVPTELDNGFLTLEDLMTRWRDRLSGCRMVVMSACRTAVGKLQRDEAVHALPVGFLYAGASSVVGSLWNVNDASTAELMSDFYRRLAEAEKDGKPVDRLQLLHEAKRELKRRHPDPFHWAPFLYIGSPR